MAEDEAGLRDEAEKWLLKESKSHPIIRKLTTAPGMGPIRTAQVVAIVATAAIGTLMKNTQRQL